MQRRRGGWERERKVVSFHVVAWWVCIVKHMWMGWVWFQPTWSAWNQEWKRSLQDILRFSALLFPLSLGILRWFTSNVLLSLLPALLQYLFYTGLSTFLLCWWSDFCSPSLSVRFCLYFSEADLKTGLLEINNKSQAMSFYTDLGPLTLTSPSFINLHSSCTWFILFVGTAVLLRDLTSIKKHPIADEL